VSDVTTSKVAIEIDNTEKFNHDLLMEVKDQSLAKDAYGDRVFEVFDFPELRDVFSVYESNANMLKRRARRVGVSAILMGTCALLIASAEPLYHHLGSTWTEIAGGLSAALGLLAVLIGSWGLWFAGIKESWLCYRMMAERLRQFHFQAIVRLLPEIEIDFRENTSQFKEARKAQFASFLARHEGSLKRQLGRILADSSNDECWMIDESDSEFPEGLSQELPDLLRAYRDLRIDHQLDFTRLKLLKEKTPFSSSDFSIYSSLEFISLCSLLTALVIDIAIAVSLAGLAWPGLLDVSGIHVLAMWGVVIALSSRALMEGLQPDREMERYHRYATEIERSKEIYERSEHLSEKLSSMRELERQSYLEMAEFLRRNYEARFVI